MIGTAVNVASRLEALTRSHNAQIVISDALRQRVLDEGTHNDSFEGFSKHPDQTIRGSEEKMTVWSL